MPDTSHRSDTACNKMSQAGMVGAVVLPEQQPMDEMESRLRAQYEADKDPVRREAYALAKRAGFDWYNTESSARRMAERAAKEILELRTATERQRTFNIFLAVFLLAVMAMVLVGCAQMPEHHVFRTVGTGVRMPDDQACSISDDGQQLLPCHQWGPP